ncbi:MAG: hypothetical protein OES79_04735 [Planctomycetota bacterium]|nr:hypothetical protein [Planctomycetota bacterium]
MRWICVPLLFASLIGAAGAVGPVAAQEPDRRQRRQRVVEGILRSLIEAQIPTENVDPRPAAGVGRPEDLRQAHGWLTGFSQESAQLVAELRQEERAAPNIRPLLADALRVKATADVAVRRSQQVPVRQVLARDIQGLDRQWRLLSHRLAAVPDLSRSCRASIKQLNEYDHNLCQFFGIEPQLERTELARLMGVIGTDLQNLREDIAYELHHGQLRSTLLAEARSLQVKISELAQAVVRKQRYEAIVREYKEYYQGWRKLVFRLRQIDKRYLSRAVNRIHQASDEVLELLWIPRSLDRDQIVYCANKFNQSVDQLLTTVSLKHMLNVSDGPAMLTCAAELHGLCTDFAQSAAGAAAIDDLLWDYRVLGVEWQNLQEYLKAIDAAEIRKRMATAQLAAGMLRDSLGVRPLDNHRSGVRLAGQIDNQSAVLARDLTNRLRTTTRYTSKFRNDMLNSAQGFHTTAHHLHESIVQQASEGHLRKHCSELAGEWERLSGYVGRCAAEDRRAVSRTCQEIATSLAKLQVLYAY